MKENWLNEPSEHIQSLTRFGYSLFEMCANASANHDNEYNKYISFNEWHLEMYEWKMKKKKWEIVKDHLLDDVNETFCNHKRVPLACLRPTQWIKRRRMNEKSGEMTKFKCLTYQHQLSSHINFVSRVVVFCLIFKIDGKEAL